MPLEMPLNIEAVYKQLSGYYDTLRKSRALDARNKVAVDIIQFYGLNFFKNEFNRNENNLYEFVIGALEKLGNGTKFYLWQSWSCFTRLIKFL